MEITAPNGSVLERTQQVSTFAYTSSNPFARIDPFGMETLVMVNNNTFIIGTHAGLIFRRNGYMTIYDPSGHYMNDSGSRGEAGTISSDEGASLGSYILYQKKDGADVYLFKFDTNEAEEQAIMDRIEKIGDPRGFNCAKSVSQVLTGIGPFKGLEVTKYPSSLFNQMVEIKANELRRKSQGAVK